MGGIASRVFKPLFGQTEIKVITLGLDAAGKVSDNLMSR
jgi:hypothetical protein